MGIATRSQEHGEESATGKTVLCVAAAWAPPPDARLHPQPAGVGWGVSPNQPPPPPPTPHPPPHSTPFLFIVLGPREGLAIRTGGGGGRGGVGGE